MDKSILKKFLTAGFMEKGKWHPTTIGAAQGGIISPTLMVLTLSGLESKLRSTKEKQRSREKINIIAYADDFIVTAASVKLLHEKVILSSKRLLAKQVWNSLRRKPESLTSTKDLTFLGLIYGNIKTVNC